MGGGTVYITGDADDRLVVTALTLDGKVKWKSPIDRAWTRSRPGARSTVTIDGGKLYLLSGNGVLACFSAATGKGIWSVEMRRLGGRSGGWGYAESPLIHGNLVIVKPGGKWSAERVIIFTEYRATQTWLNEILVAEGLASGDRLMTLFGPVRFTSYDKKTNQNKLTTYVVQWQYSRLKLIWPRELANADYVYPVDWLSEWGY